MWLEHDAIMVNMFGQLPARKAKKPQISPAQNPLKKSQVDLQLTDGSYSLMNIKYTYSLIISSFYWDKSQNFAAP